MISNISHNDKEVWDAIHDHVGRPYKFMQRIRMGGIGSPRFRIIGSSLEIAELLKNTNQTNFCNIEIRSEGIVVGFRSLQEVYAWSTPYYKLSIHSTGKQYTIYHDTVFIQIENEHTSRVNQQFFNKLREVQKKSLGSNTYVDDL